MRKGEFWFSWHSDLQWRSSDCPLKSMFGTVKTLNARTVWLIPHELSMLDFLHPCPPWSQKGRRGEEWKSLLLSGRACKNELGTWLWKPLWNEARGRWWGSEEREAFDSTLSLHTKPACSRCQFWSSFQWAWAAPRLMPKLWKRMSSQKSY